MHIRDFKRGAKINTLLAIKYTGNVVASSDHAQGKMDMEKGKLIVCGKEKKGTVG
jgi:hypothetical protein